MAGTTQIKTKGQDGQGITVERIVKAKDGTVIHKDEFYRRTELPQKLTAINKRLRTWEHVYNCIRPHQALDYKTPKAFYRQLIT